VVLACNWLKSKRQVNAARPNRSNFVIILIARFIGGGFPGERKLLRMGSEIFPKGKVTVYGKIRLNVTYKGGTVRCKFGSYRLAASIAPDVRSSSSVATRIFSGRKRFTEPSRKSAVIQRPGETVSTDLMRQNSSDAGVALLSVVSTIIRFRWAARYSAAELGLRFAGIAAGAGALKSVIC